MPKQKLDKAFESLRFHWYNNPKIIFNLIESLKYKETVFLREGCVHRCIKSNASHYLMKNFSRYHFFENENFNLYNSLAHYPNLPMFSFNRYNKRTEQDQFNKQYTDFMKGYDFLIDIDNPDIKSALNTLKAVMKDFKGVPYYVLFSGKKGYHLKVDYFDFPKELKELNWNQLSELFKKFED